MTLFDAGDATAGPRPSTRLGPVGQAILAYLREPDHGTVSPLQAGLICHDLRKRRGGSCGVGSHTVGDASRACCGYTSDDGLLALKRLVRAGYLQRTGHGRYEPTWRATPDHRATAS